MPFRVQCPGCQASLALPDTAAGKQARCQRCQKVFVVAPPKPKPPEEEQLELVDAPQPPRARRDAIQARRVHAVALPPERPRTGVEQTSPRAAEARAPRSMLPAALAVVGILAAVGIGGAWWLRRPAPANQPDSGQVAAADSKAGLPRPADAASVDKAPREAKPAESGAAPEEDTGTPQAQPSGKPQEAAPNPAAPGGQPALPLVAAADGKLSPATLAALKAATVFVKVELGQLRASGSGFLMKVEGRSGYVVTNDHVIRPPRGINLRPHVSLVFWSGTKQEKTAPAQIVATDSSRDLAVLKVTDIDQFPSPLNLEQKLDLTETMTVWILGFPFGEMLSERAGNPTLTIGKGTISSIRNDERDEMKVVQIDGDVNPGNSGGPVVDSAGRLVGVSVAKIKGTHIGMAIPPGELTKMLNGRVGGIGFHQSANTASSTQVRVVAALIDPMNKISKVGVSYVRSDALKEPIVKKPDGSWPPLPATENVDLAIKDQSAEATFLLAAAAGTEFMFQTVFTNGEGKTILTQPSRFRVSGSQVTPVAEAPPPPVAVPNPIPVPKNPLPTTSPPAMAEGAPATFNLPGMGGFAVSNDNSTLVVSLTSKTELVFFDTLAGKESKRVTVEFQPTQIAWSGNVLFVAQKGSGIVHLIDANSGKELAAGNASSAVRNLAVVKGICFASTSDREVYAIGAKGKSTKTSAQGTFVAADPKGAFVYTCIDGRATTDVYKYKVEGPILTNTNVSFRSLRASLINVQAIGVSADGKQFGVVAGGGWSDLERKRHYSVPLYSTEDMKSQLGEMETGAYPCGMASHPVLPLVLACTGKEGAVFSAKSYAASQKFAAPQQTPGAAAPSVLAFVGRGQKLAWGTSSGDAGVLKFYDLQLTKEQQAELNKGFSRK
jgi:S1-C subfamily serine protease